jgi:endonuclease/exonuclease/phosphatase (EEP) superfamily protein YafD
MQGQASSVRSRVVITLLVSGWVVVAALVLAALLHIVARDRNALVFELDAYTFWLYAPAYVVLVGALIGRRPALAGVAVILVACHLVWVVPSLAGAARVPPAARTAPRFTLVTANVHYDNPDPMKLLRELAATGADVLDLQEITPAWVDDFRRAGLLDAYPYHVLAPLGGPRGTAILSRLPLRDATTVTALGNGLASANIELAGRSVRLLAVHPLAPVTFSVYKAQRDAITEFVQHENGPLILAGDFNTTQFNAWLGRLGRLGLRSAHVLLGQGRATTWPNGHRFLPPIRLDHVLVSRSVVPLSIHEGRGSGSDHKPVIVVLALT